MMARQTQQATLAEIYSVLNQLVESYTDVMKLFQGVITKVGDIEAAVGDIREFVNNEYTDAVQARDIWRRNAEVHRQQAEDLRDKLKTLEVVASQLDALANHPHLVAAKLGKLLPTREDDDPPSDFKVYVDNEAEKSHMMIIDETLDA